MKRHHCIFRHLFLALLSMFLLVSTVCESHSKNNKISFEQAKQYVEATIKELKIKEKILLDVAYDPNYRAICEGKITERSKGHPPPGPMGYMRCMIKNANLDGIRKYKPAMDACNKKYSNLPSFEKPEAIDECLRDKLYFEEAIDNHKFLESDVYGNLYYEATIHSYRSGVVPYITPTESGRVNRAIIKFPFDNTPQFVPAGLLVYFEVVKNISEFKAIPAPPSSPKVVTQVVPKKTTPHVAPQPVQIKAKTQPVVPPAKSAPSPAPTAGASQLKVTGTAIRFNNQKNKDHEYTGPCPVEIKSLWRVAGTAPTSLSYTFRKSDGTTDTIQRTAEIKSAEKPAMVDTSWIVGKANDPQYANFSGYTELIINAPEKISKKVNFTIHCQ